MYVFGDCRRHLEQKKEKERKRAKNPERRTSVNIKKISAKEIAYVRAKIVSRKLPLTVGAPLYYGSVETSFLLQSLFEW